MFNRARAEWMPEAAPLFPPRTTRQLHVVPPRLLLVCDSAAKVARLEPALKVGAVEIVSVINHEELKRVCGQEYALAVIDVAPATLVKVLKTIRARARQVGLPVLVEASEIMGEASFAGVLPQYRAMPCGYGELVVLTRQRLSPIKHVAHKRKVL